MSTRTFSLMVAVACFAVAGHLFAGPPSGDGYSCDGDTQCVEGCTDVVIPAPIPIVIGIEVFKPSNSYFKCIYEPEDSCTADTADCSCVIHLGGCVDKGNEGLNGVTKLPICCRDCGGDDR